MKRFWWSIIAILMVCGVVWAADYSSNKTVNQLTDVSGNLVRTTRIVAQDSGDTDVIGAVTPADIFGLLTESDIPSELARLASPSFTTPDIGAATGTSLAATGNVSGATYGSDSSISDAELLTLDDGATTEILVGGGAGSAPVWTTATGSGAPMRGTAPTITTSLSFNAVTDTVAGIQNQNLVDKSAAETVTGKWNLMGLALTAQTSEPSGLAVGDIVLADHTTWDPNGESGTDAYYVLVTAAGSPNTYKTLWDVAGNFYLQSIATPTLLTSELNDTSTPHTLTAAELKGTILTNSGSVGPEEWDAPARTEGWNFIFVKEADQNITIDPNGTENWYFRTGNSAYTLNGAGVSIINTTAGKSTLTCFSTESSVFCTGDVNWAKGT